MEIRTDSDGSRKVYWNEWGSGVLVRDVDTQYRDPKGDPCLARTAAQHFLGERTLEEYLTILLLHLRAEGGVIHVQDCAHKSGVNQELDINPLLFVDVVAGTVRARQWTPGFKRFDNSEWTLLRTLAALTWRTSELAEFDRLNQELGLDLSSLSAEAADILAVICYARRHVDLLGHILSQVPAPDKSSFDWFSAAIIDARVQGHYKQAQHSPPDPANVELEVRLWTHLLNASWIHQPVTTTLAVGLINIAHQVRGQGSWKLDPSSPYIDALHAALAANNLSPDMSAMGSFLAGCPDLARAQLYFTRFPPAERPVSSWRTLACYPSHSGSALVPVIESESLSGSDKLAVLKRLMEIPLIDLKAEYSRQPWAGEWCWGLPMETNDHLNALEAAAWRGDVEIGRLLVEHGANDDSGGAAEVARKRGQKRFERWLLKALGE